MYKINFLDYIVNFGNHFEGNNIFLSKVNLFRTKRRSLIRWLFTVIKTQFSFLTEIKKYDICEIVQFQVKIINDIQN